MAVFGKEKHRRALQRWTVESSATPVSPNRQPSQKLAQEIKEGKVSPAELYVDSDPQQSILQKDRSKRPWHDLESFLTYVKERRHKFGLGIFRKKRLRSRPESPRDRNYAVSFTPADSRKVAVSRDPTQISDNGARYVLKQESTPPILTDSLPAPSNDVANTEASGSGPNQKISAREGDDFVPSDVVSDNCTAAATGDESFREESMQESPHKMAMDGAHLNTNIIPSISTPRKAQHKEWVSVAVMIKADQAQHSEKVFFDTLSEDNLASEKFVADLNLKTRPILPEDIMIYNTPKGDFIPRLYFEVDLKCPRHGIDDFVKVRFVVVESLAEGMGLVLGSNFMSLYDVRLLPRQGRDMFPVVARAPGEAAKAEQQQYLERLAKDTERANNFAASTAGTTTGVSGAVASQGKQYAGSSHTSTSSAGDDKPQ